MTNSDMKRNYEAGGEYAASAGWRQEERERAMKALEECRRTEREYMKTRDAVIERTWCGGIRTRYVERRTE